MTGYRIFWAAMVLFLGAAAPAAVPGCAAPAPESLHASISGFDQPEEQQLQATRLLNMLASMVRERSPFLASVLVFIGMILKFITHPTFLWGLLILLLIGITASAALLIWAAWKRKKAGKPGPPRLRRPFPPALIPPQAE